MKRSTLSRDTQNVDECVSPFCSVAIVQFAIGCGNLAVFNIFRSLIENSHSNSMKKKKSMRRRMKKTFYQFHNAVSKLALHSVTANRQYGTNATQLIVEWRGSSVYERAHDKSEREKEWTKNSQFSSSFSFVLYAPSLVRLFVRLLARYASICALLIQWHS